MASKAEVDRLVLLVQAMKNRDLIKVCQQSNLARSGNKADLHRRINYIIDDCARDPNPKRFMEVRDTIMAVATGDQQLMYRISFHHSGSASSSPSNHGNARMASPYNTKPSINGLNGGSGANGATKSLHHQSHNPSYGGESSQRPPKYSQFGLQFKPSPFYEIDTQIGEIRHCDAMSQHRNSVPIQLRASTNSELQRCLGDPSLRVMVFCAAANLGPQDIAFPYQCEIKVNGGEVKANLRGLKNKPGSTRPVDITSLLRLNPTNYGNTLEFTYALTSKRYYLALYLCKTHSLASLSDRIRQRGRISIASVMTELTKQAQDPDVVATSQVLSLKCPLTYMRLSLPVRSVTCKHIQCFDAMSYLQLQEQGPQWLCPVCSCYAPFDQLAVDEYVRDILDRTSKSQDQVTIEPDGTWHAERSETGGLATPKASDASYINDDDFVILPPSRMKSGMPSTPASSTVVTGLLSATPSNPSPTPARSVGGSASTGSKRQHEVIDLTLSDDEDDQRPAKRPNLGFPSNGPRLPLQF